MTGPAAPLTGQEPDPALGGAARRLTVAFVLGTASGGTVRHVAMLAHGCARAGLVVSACGPEGTRPLFAARAGREPAPAGAAVARPPEAAPNGAARSPIGFAEVPIGDRPRPARDLGATLRLRRLLVRASPDVVHAHGVRAGALAALALAVRRRRPALVVTVHNAAPADPWTAVGYRLLERICVTRADMMLCVSPDLEARMGRLGARKTGRAVVAAPRAPRPSAAAVARARSQIAADGRPVVLAVGRLARQKGYELLLEAAARWQRRDPRPVLAVAGTGPLAAELARKARSCDLDVRFLGRRGDVPALLAAADVFVMASRWEGQPLALQEALLAGRPVVAFGLPGIAELTGGDGALLVPPADPERLATAVLSVLDDPGMAGRLAAAARDRSAALPSEADATRAAIGLYSRLAVGMSL
jgi:glycosyltransferase involved in cell wall biosynthesis